MEKYAVIGLMSGTSLDGVDIAYCNFELEDDSWKFTIKETTTVKYAPEWHLNLKESIFKDANQLQILDNLYGEYLGNLCKSFINKHKIKPDLIASHGHTVFHQPDKGFTLQIGNGDKIAKITNTPTVYDFRSLDVKLGGQGAPLVPIGDRLLFKEYDFCLNLGGFANISFEKNTTRIAFDICPLNIVINEVCEHIGLSFDKNGEIAKQGEVNTNLLNELNDLKYYAQVFPKSLGKEFVLEEIQPLLNKYPISIAHKLRTFYEHIAIQISKTINTETGETVLVTGGGTYNVYLLELIRKHINRKIVIPSKTIIDFKEAMIFAFLGVLKKRGENNCLASVTGASQDCSGGILAIP